LEGEVAEASFALVLEQAAGSVCCRALHSRRYTDWLGPVRKVSEEGCGSTGAYVLMENLNGLVVDTRVTEAQGRAQGGELPSNQLFSSLLDASVTRIQLEGLSTL
jgi:hypothetical protein